MDKVKAKAFIHYLDHFHENLYEMKKFFDDKRIPANEKKILECWLLLRENKFNEISKIISKINIDYDDLINAQKDLIWGITLNNKTEFDLAVTNINKAIPVIEKYKIHHQVKKAVFNLFIANLNKKSLKAMEENLKWLETLKCDDKQEEIQLEICYFSYYAFTAQKANAITSMKKLDKLCPEMSESRYMGYLQSKFYFLSQIENFDECEEVLLIIKNKKNYSYSAIYKYMNGLLNHYLYQKALYVYEKDFAQYPYLYLQIKVIQSFSSGKPGDAKKYWAELSSLYPENYLDNFEYKGDKSIFTLNLDKYLVGQNLNTKEVVNVSNKEFALLSFLQNTIVPIDKEKLYSDIWSKPCVDKQEMKNLSKLVTRLRAKGHDIGYKQGAYFLVRKEKKSA
jgi:hypothetical protein